MGGVSVSDVTVTCYCTEPMLLDGIYDTHHVYESINFKGLLEAMFCYIFSGMQTMRVPSMPNFVTAVFKTQRFAKIRHFKL